MKSRKTEKAIIWIRIMAVIGLIMSVKLAFIYYSANFDKYALSSFCSINDFIDCDGVAKTKLAQVFGIPLAYWGIFFYITILFLTFVENLKKNKYLKFLEVFKNPKAYIATLGVIAFICSMGLAFVSLHFIKKICILCVVTYFIDFIIALIAINGKFKNILSSFKTTFLDFIDGAKKYTKTFIILVLLSASFLAYSGITLNFVPHIKRSESILKYRRMKQNPFKVKGNVLGEENGKVIIDVYSDYICPLCYIHNIMLHEAAGELKNIKIIHHNYPFDKACNKFIGVNMHPYACFMSKAALAAKRQNNYWGMSSLLYEKQPKDLKSLLELVEQLGFDKMQFVTDMNSQEVAAELQTELQDAISKGINATPTMFVNGEKYVGVKPYKEIKELLIKHGATQKQKLKQKHK